jgi:hypothetical protein
MTAIIAARPIIPRAFDMWMACDSRRKLLNGRICRGNPCPTWWRILPKLADFPNPANLLPSLCRLLPRYIKHNPFRLTATPEYRERAAGT